MTADISALPYELRSLLIRRLNGDGEDVRDVGMQCGYVPCPSVIDYYQAYISNGIAKRVIDLKPEETWSIDPKIRERDGERSDGEDTSPWEDIVEEIVNDHNLWAVCEQADKNSRIGHYGVILLGFDDGGELRDPVQGWGQKNVSHSLLYANTFPEPSATITAWEKEKTNPRYGQPTMYRVTIGEYDGSLVTEDVHWHRIVHIVDNCVGNGVRSAPVLSTLFNWVHTDLLKLIGSSMEAYWQGAFPGYFLKVVAGNTISEAERKEITSETNNFVNTLKRWILMGGVDLQALRAQWVDPTPGLELILKICAISEGCPVPTFVGAEEGQLAGDQNTTHWGQQIHRRRIRHAGPYIARKLIHALMAAGVIPHTDNAIHEEWKSTRVMTDNERATYVKTIVEAIVMYLRGGANQIIPPITLLTKMCGFEQKEAEDMLAQALKAMEEAAKEIDPATGLPMETPEEDMGEPADVEGGGGNENLPQKQNPARVGAQPVQ